MSKVFQVNAVITRASIHLLTDKTKASNSSLRTLEFTLRAQ